MDLSYLVFFLFFWGGGGGELTLPVFLAQECFQHLGESTLKRIKAVLRAKGDLTWYDKCVTNKVFQVYIRLETSTNHSREKPYDVK